MEISFGLYLLKLAQDVLYKLSLPDNENNTVKLGDLVRQQREKSGMTQIELAQKSGTSRTYISRLENNRSDIELTTLQKIVQAGFGKALVIKIK